MTLLLTIGTSICVSLTLMTNILMQSDRSEVTVLIPKQVFEAQFEYKTMPLEQLYERLQDDRSGMPLLLATADPGRGP